jgi:hypothetical protein
MAAIPARYTLVDFLREVFVRHVRENTTASTPQRRGRHTGTSAASSLLLERLLGRVLDLFAVFLSASALTGVSLKSNNNLVNQIFVVSTAKNGFRRFKFRGRLTLFIQEIDLHQFAPFASAF